LPFPANISAFPWYSLLPYFFYLPSEEKEIFHAKVPQGAKRTTFLPLDFTSLRLGVRSSSLHGQTKLATSLISLTSSAVTSALLPASEFDSPRRTGRNVYLADKNAQQILANSLSSLLPYDFFLPPEEEMTSHA